MSNNSSTCYWQPSAEIIAFFHFLNGFTILEVVLGLLFNLLALWIFCFRMKCWKPHTIFLFNLMLADFLLLVSVPFRIRSDDWVYGHIYCRLNFYMLALNRSASIGFMTTVVLNRYFKVLHPLHCVSLMSTRQSTSLVGFIWAIVIVLHFPLLTTERMVQIGNQSMCLGFSESESVRLALYNIIYVTEFIISWIILLFCSARIICHLKRQEQIIKQRKFKKAIRSVVVISLVFTVCFLPAFVIGLGVLIITKYKPEDCTSLNLMFLSFIWAIALPFLNSALDPVIYIFSSSMFRSALKSIFRNLRQ